MTKGQNNTELPKGWKWVKLEKIAKWGSGGTPTSTNPNYYNGDIPWLIIGDLNDGNILISRKKITKLGLENSSSKMVKPESVLIAMYGSIGKLGINKIPVATNQAIAFTEHLYEETNNKYLFYYLLHIRSKLHALGKGGTQKNISQGVLKQVDFPLPPLFIQQSIVSKIEELLSELDKGIENLRLAQQQLKTYRQSVFKWAFEGKLTHHWRMRRDILLNTDDLIKQIKQEREQQAALSGVKGKPIPPIIKDELKELTDLPNSFAWLRLGNLVWSVKDGPHYSPKYQEKGVPFISGGNIKPNGIDFTNTKFISEQLHLELSKRCKPEIGDVLYTKGGTTGIARVNTYKIEFNVWVHVAVLKTIKSINPFYLQYVLNSTHCYRQSQKYTHGVGNQDLGLTRMILITVPICSLEEQNEIVQVLESVFSEADKIEDTINESLRLAEVLKQSILKKAFEGRLTEHEYNLNND